MKTIDNSLTEYAAVLGEEISSFIPQGKTSNASSPFCDEMFNELALSLFALQYESNGVLKKWCQGRGVKPGGITSWKEIPALPVVLFKEAAVSCLTEDQRAFWFQSSGTTEQRHSRHHHSAESLAFYERGLMPWFSIHLFGDAPTSKFRALVLTPSSQDAPHSSLAHMLQTVSSEHAYDHACFAGQVQADGGWELDFDAINETLSECQLKNIPVLVMGTAFNFVQLLDQFEARKCLHQLPPGSRVMETGGYKGRSRALSQPQLYALIEKHLGIGFASIVSEYGMCELSSQAYNWRVPACPTGADNDLSQRFFQFPPWCRIKIVSPETALELPAGQPGLVQVCDLANVWSVATVQTGDLGIAIDGGFRLLGRALRAEPRGCSLMSSN